MESEVIKKDFVMIQSVDQEINNGKQSVLHDQISRHIEQFYSNLMDKTKESTTITFPSSIPSNLLPQVPNPIESSSSQSKSQGIALYSLFRSYYYELEAQWLLFKRKIGMDTMDTLLLFVPSIPLFLHSILKRNRSSRRFTLWWILVGFLGAYMKFVNQSFRWWGLVVNPSFLLITQGMKGKWGNGILYGLAWFLAGIALTRSSGLISTQLLK